jgi:succinyl-diaminopimelate desuccinylase
LIDAQETKLLASVETSSERIVSYLQMMLKIPTVNPPGEAYDDFVNAAEDMLRSKGIKTRIVDGSGGKGARKPNLLAHVGESRAPILILNGHYDVVPAGAGWDVDPFAGIVSNGRVYGRGSVDMKGALACMIVAAEVLQDMSLLRNGALELSFVPDEESDGNSGSEFLVSTGYAKAEFCVIGEPSGLGTIWNAHKGCIAVEITIEGKPAHASTPWLGINAFEEAVFLVNKLNAELKPVLKERVSRQPCTVIGGERATVNIGGLVQAGAAFNVVPDNCVLTIDRRVIPEERLEDAKKELLSIIDEARKERMSFKATTKILSGSQPSYVAEDSLICKTVLASAKDACGIEPVVRMCTGTLDMRHFVSGGVPTVAFGPGDLSLAHTNTESVAIDDLVKVCKAYALTAYRLLG